MNHPTLSQVDGASVERRGDAATAGPPGFDLLAEVGRGGMGVVWRARDTALDREVAVKLLGDQYAPGSATARRFTDEARITGQLQHPGIPAVYQVGALADGRPFLAMKLIKGDTLADRLKAGDPLDPLGVFEAVAQAVGYAHAHGVIHRDLKPQNVMVGAFGEVQVLDWGLAKVLASVEASARRGADPEATVGTATEIKSTRDTGGSFTEYGSVLGTPAFMAPEQAAGETDRTDARSDVFGLGAVLCVLLTGRPPFDGTDAASVRLNAVRGKTEAAFARLDGCGADPGVVALCKRCLAFDPGERPATGDVVAAEVAALRRAADDRARQAERDKLAAEVRLAEGRKRRRVLLWAGGTLAAVLLLGLAGTTAGLVRADAARRDAEAAGRATEAKRVEAEAARQAEADQRQTAEAARAEAQAKEAEANAVVKFFQDKVFAAARPKGQAGGLGANVTLRDAVAASVPALEEGFAAQPLVEARLRLALGNTFYYLAEHEQARAQCERARALYTRHRGPDHPDTLRSMNYLATSYAALGRHADALRLFEETLAIRRRVLPPDHPETLASMGNLANSYAALGRHADALRLREETLAIMKRVLPPDHPETLASMNNLATSYAALGRHADALRLFEETLAICRRVLPPDHPDTLKSMYNLANSYAALGRHADALKLREETLAIRKRVLPPDHPDTLKSMVTLADSLLQLDRGVEAIPLLDEAIAKASASPAVNSQLIPYAFGLRGRHFQQAGDPAGCRATAEMWEKLNRTDAGSLYDAACFRAVAAAVQAKAPGADAARLAQEDADRAMAWLTKAVAAGYKDRARMETDDNLAALRGRADFRKLLESLPKMP